MWIIFILTFTEILRLLDDPYFSRNSYLIVKINATIISNIRDTKALDNDDKKTRPMTSLIL